jgi:hypothetical protein
VALTYAHGETRSQSLLPPLQPVTHTENRTFFQQYYLALDRSLYPNLKLTASGWFTKSDNAGIHNGERTDTTSLFTRPYIDLMLRTPLYSIGTTYSKATTETKAEGQPSFTTIHETYTGIFGWKPVELPTLDLKVSRDYDYDKERFYRDLVTDQVFLYSNYLPTRTLRLRYQGNYQDSQDKKTEVETKVIGNNIRVTYGDQFFDNLLRINAYEDYSRRTTETITSGTGNVDVQLFASDGLLVSSNLPLTVRLNPAPFLVDAVTTGPANPTNNIGTDTYPLDMTARNAGLQFAAATQMNALRVWISSLSGPTLATAIPTYLSNAVSQSFQWDVYTSTDNQTWTLLQTAAPAAYDIDTSTTGLGHFRITFANVTTPYIKVVVTPLLPPAAGGPTDNFPGVYVTEIQALLNVPAADIEGRTTATSQLTNLNAQLRIYQTTATSLYYDFVYFSNRSESVYTTTRTSSLSHALSLTHRLSAVFSGSARATRSDETDLNGTSVTQDFNAQIMAVPIRTLSHNLGYNVSTHQAVSGLRSKNQALFMTNTAELYRNFTAFLNGGVSTATTETETQTDSSNYAWGLNVVPIKTLNMTLSSSTSKDEQTGPNAVPQTSHIKSDVLTVSYYPFNLLYLFFSWQKYTTDEFSNTIKNYGVTWSPLPGGSIQLSVSYTETLQTRDNSVDKTFTPSARWNINNRGTYLNAVYTSTENTSDISEATSRLYAATLNIAL